MSDQEGTPKAPPGWISPEEVAKIRAGLETRINEITAEKKTFETRATTAEAKVAEAEAAQTAALEAARTEHTSALEALQGQLAEAQTTAKSARTEAAFIRAGIDDGEARDLVQYQYDRLSEEGRPDFGAWLTEYTKAPPKWLQPYVEKAAADTGAADAAAAQAAAEAVTDNGASDTGTAEAAGNNGAQGAAEAAAAAVKAKAPPNTDKGAGSIGTKGEPTLQELMSMSNADYKARRAELLPGAKPIG